MGLPASLPCVLAPLPVPPPPPATPEDGLAHALRYRPEVASQEWAVRAALAQVKVAALTSAPSISVFSQYSGLNNSLGSLTDLWYAGAQVNIPVVDGGQSRLLKREAEIAVDQARQQLEQNRRTVTSDVAQAWIDLDTCYKQIAQSRVSVERARETLRIAALRYREALAGSTDLLNAQDTYSSARQSLATSECNYYLAQVNWRRAISAEHPVPLPPSLHVDWELPPAISPPCRKEDPLTRLAHPSGTRRLWALLVAVLLLPACSSVAPRPFLDKTPDAPLVKVVAVQKGTVPQVLTFTGVLRARRRASVSAGTSGVVLRVAARDGDRVTRGQPVIWLNDSELQSRMREQQAAVSVAQARIPELATNVSHSESKVRAAIRQARESLQQAQILVQSTRTQFASDKADRIRMEGLYKEKAVPRHQVEQAQLKCKLTADQLSTALSKLRLRPGEPALAGGRLA